jgi:ribosomal-protein-alanine N-acetyltransferase
MITCLRGGPKTVRAELVSVAVDPEARHSGAASALLESTLRRLGRRGAARLNLVVRINNLWALAFYEKYGFRRVRVVRGYYEDGGDGIAMARPVASRRR